MGITPRSARLKRHLVKAQSHGKGREEKCRKECPHKATLLSKYRVEQKKWLEVQRIDLKLSMIG